MSESNCIMEIKEYFKYINKKADRADKKAKNPFLECNFTYNPFVSAFEQTYIWVEKTKEKRY